MKKNLLIFALLFCFPVTINAQSYVQGDVNHDSSVNINDALLIARSTAGLNPSGFYPSQADVNCSNAVDINDALVVARYSAGLITSLLGCTSTPTPTRTPTATPTPAPTITIDANIVVAKDGSGQFATVQAAVNSVPSANSRWLTIHIKNGTYKEVIHVNKPYIKMIGESNTGTILTYDNCSSTAGGTSASASVFFEATNFIAENLTFENAFNYDTSTEANKQGVAAEPTADRQVFRNCRITGHQDTLYVRKARQYFRDCYIVGVTDFIFGDGTAVFDNCDIHTHSKGSASAMTAPNTAATTTYGLVFLNCKLTADSGIAAGSISLGRPWGEDGSCHFLYCALGAHCGGWTDMSSNTWQNARFGEYRNTGAGAVINPNRPQLTDAEAANYTVTNILKGSDNWDPNNF